jgi:hypothetical protein
MKVICIDNMPTKCRNTGRKVSVPCKGDIDIVTGTTIYWGEELYFLKRFGKEIAFSMYHFIPLPDPQEEANLS